MTEKITNDYINYFPSISGNNEELLDLLRKTSELLCKWYSDTNKLSPLPLNNKFKVTYPQKNGSDVNNLLNEIEEYIKKNEENKKVGNIVKVVNLADKSLCLISTKEKNLLTPLKVTQTNSALSLN